MRRRSQEERRGARRVGEGRVFNDFALAWGMDMGVGVGVVQVVVACQGLGVRRVGRSVG